MLDDAELLGLHELVLHSIHASRLTDTFVTAAPPHLLLAWSCWCVYASNGPRCWRVCWRARWTCAPNSSPTWCATHAQDHTHTCTHTNTPPPPPPPILFKVLTGGGSQIPGLPRRLAHELRAAHPTLFRGLKITVEWGGVGGMWVGGSIVASLSNYNMWCVL